MRLYSWSRRSIIVPICINLSLFPAMIQALRVLQRSRTGLPFCIRIPGDIHTLGGRGEIRVRDHAQGYIHDLSMKSTKSMGLRPKGLNDERL